MSTISKDLCSSAMLALIEAYKRAQEICDAESPTDSERISDVFEELQVQIATACYALNGKCGDDATYLRLTELFDDKND